MEATSILSLMGRVKGTVLLESREIGLWLWFMSSESGGGLWMNDHELG